MSNTTYKYNFLELQDAVRIMLWYVPKPLSATEWVPVTKALGRITSCDIVSEISQPPFDRSPLDGYAFHAKDSAGATIEHPAYLPVVWEVTAGDAPTDALLPGQAVRIMTGAPIPKGADCVIRQEDTDYGETRVAIFQEMHAFENYCYAGEDFKAGDLLLKKGTKITSVEMGILASMGKCEVEVYKKIRVGIFSTGDELTNPGNLLEPGKIYNSNLYVLIGRMQELGMEVACVGKLPDTEEGVAAKLMEILPDVDLILTTGGVSVGKKDIMHGALDIMKAEKVFWRVQIKPGTPTIFAVMKNKPLVALSGNPFGALTHLELLVRPLLAAMSGDDTVSPDYQTAVMADTFSKGGKMHRIVRAYYRNGKVYLPKGLHSSGVLSSMQGCNCLIDIQPGSKGLAPGDEVKILLLQKSDPVPCWMENIDER